MYLNLSRIVQYVHIFYNTNKILLQRQIFKSFTINTKVCIVFTCSDNFWTEPVSDSSGRTTKNNLDIGQTSNRYLLKLAPLIYSTTNNKLAPAVFPEHLTQ